MLSNIASVSDKCPAGTYRNSSMATCTKCDTNTVSKTGAAFCTVCEPGTVANENKTKCGKLVSSKTTKPIPISCCIFSLKPQLNNP